MTLVQLQGEPKLSSWQPVSSFGTTAPPDVAGPKPIWATSHAYLRLAMVLMLIALAVAVFYQTSKQGLLLGSVSAYYYTPAQAVFVGALISVGVGMIALRGKA